MTRPAHQGPVVRREISPEEIAQGIARARHLRAEAFSDLISTVNRKVSGAGRRLVRPSLSPSHPRGSF